MTTSPLLYGVFAAHGPLSGAPAAFAVPVTLTVLERVTSPLEAVIVEEPWTLIVAL